MEWVASTLHTTSEHGVSSITTADAHTSAASSRLNWRPPADLNGLVRFAERRNLVSVRVQSHFNWPLTENTFHGQKKKKSILKCFCKIEKSDYQFRDAIPVRPSVRPLSRNNSAPQLIDFWWALIVEDFWNNYRKNSTFSSTRFWDIAQCTVVIPLRI